MSPQFWELHWTLDHYREEAPHDLHLEPSLGVNEDISWHFDAPSMRKPFRTPTLFGGVFFELVEIDYPSNELDWPILPDRVINEMMLRDYEDVYVMPITIIDTVMTDEDEKRWSGSYDQSIQYALGRNDLRRDDFSALQIRPLENVLDLEKSKYQTFADSQDIWWVEHYVLKKPVSELPPLFRLAEVPRTLFVTQRAREVLKSLGVRGPVYRSPGGAPAQDERDHVVML